MTRIEKIRARGAGAEAVMDLQVSTVDDLPGEGDTVDGYTPLPGSIAQVIQTGDFYTLDDDGAWYTKGAS